MNSTNLNKPTHKMNTSPYLLLLIFPFAALWANQGLDDLNRQMQVDELQWQIDETKRSADEAAHEARKVQEQLKKQQKEEWYRRHARDPMDPLPATIDGQAQRTREQREAEELAQAQREADQVNARIKWNREMQAIEERNRIEAERLKQDEQEPLEDIYTYGYS